VEDAEVLRLFDTQMRRDAGPDGPGARVERVGRVVRQVGGEAHAWAGVLWSDLDEETADEAIDAQLRWMAGAEGAGREFEWKLYSHDRPADLGERLRAAGFAPEPAETLMVAEVAALPADPAPPEGVRLVTVTDAAGVDLAVDVHERAFGARVTGLRERLHDQFAHAPDTLGMVIAMAGDLPVCAARVEFLPGTDFAGLWGGGTVEAWRGRGVYRAVVAHRARTAATRGIRYLQVDASDDSRPILRRLGFVPLSVTTPYRRQG
jgi:GNAT superfamily N-acetyltransferase